MTTNPEQAVPPLSAEESLKETRRQRDDLKLEVMGLRHELAVARGEEAIARRQRDERPAGRVVWRGNTADWFAEMDATDSLVAVPVPPGTEVAVVVLAAGGAQSGEGE